MSKIFRCSYRVAGVTLALLWLFQASAVAGIYKWRDDQGKPHFTDDRAKIPLKYRENAQKFKGVTEPKVVEVPEPEGEPETSTENGTDKEDQVSADAQPDSKTEKVEEAKKEEQKSLDPETIKAIKLARTYLEDENYAYLRVLQRPYDVKRSKKYVKTIKSMIEQKTKTIKQLKGFKLKSIKKTRSFLSKTLVQDIRLEESEDEDFLKGLRSKVLKDADKKKKLIEKLLADLPSDVNTTEDDETLVKRIFNFKKKKK